MDIRELEKMIKNRELDARLSYMYGPDEATLERQRERYCAALKRFAELFPTRCDVSIFSAPGRTEIGGNHTDHQHGCALAAAVDMDVIAVVAFHEDGVVRLFSEGYYMSEVDLSELYIHEEEKGCSVSLIRGIAARFEQMGAHIGGFDAYTVSDVLSGSGLSSSAAFETLIGTIIDSYYNDGNAGAVEIAKIGQYAENVFFDKGCGLLDQTVCSAGGFVFIDFADPADPVVEKYSFDFEKAGYNLCITDTKGSHSDLTDDYIAVPAEMQSVAAQFGKGYLREVDEEEFFRSIPSLRGKCSDRALMRAVHYFTENRRAVEEAHALERGDIEEFFRLYKSSAASSERLLQNLYSVKTPADQGIPLGLMMSRLILGDYAAVRVHGGGFAGTIQAFVPVEKTKEYARRINELFGGGSCHIIRIRQEGGVKVI